MPTCHKRGISGVKETILTARTKTIPWLVVKSYGIIDGLGMDRLNKIVSLKEK
jgi:hypothetical protein